MEQCSEQFCEDEVMSRVVKIARGGGGGGDGPGLCCDGVMEEIGMRRRLMMDKIFLWDLEG